MNIKDSAGRVIDYLPLDLTEGETSATLIFKVTPAADSRLISDSDPNVMIQARETGSGFAFVDLAGGIDLSAYPSGVPIDFDFRAVAGAFDGRKRAMLAVVVSSRSPAGWVA